MYVSVTLPVCLQPCPQIHYLGLHQSSVVLIKVHCKSTKMRNFIYGYCLLFDTAYRGKISIFNFYLLEYTILWFNMCRHCEMIVTIKLIITSIISHSYHFFSVWWEYSWSILSANIRYTARFSNYSKHTVQFGFQKLFLLHSWNFIPFDWPLPISPTHQILATICI